MSTHLKMAHTDGASVVAVHLDYALACWPILLIPNDPASFESLELLLADLCQLVLRHIEVQIWQSELLALLPPLLL